MPGNHGDSLVAGLTAVWPPASPPPPHEVPTLRPVAADHLLRRQAGELLGRRVEDLQGGLAPECRTQLGVVAPHRDDLVQGVAAVGLDGREEAVVEHGQGVHESGPVAGAADLEGGLDESPARGRAGGPETPSGLQPGPRPPHGHRARQPDVAQLLRIALDVTPHHGEVLVDPDVDAAAVGGVAVAAAHHDEALPCIAPAPDQPAPRSCPSRTASRPTPQPRRRGPPARVPAAAVAVRRRLRDPSGTRS